MNIDALRARQGKSNKHYFLNITKVVAGFIAFAALLAFLHVPAYASKDVQIFVVNDQNRQGNLVNSSSTQPFIQGHRLMVPLRALAETLQCEVNWLPAERAVTIQRNGQTTKLWIDQQHYLKRGVNAQLDVAPVIYGDTTMVPIRFIAEAIGHDIFWDEVTRRAYVAAHPQLTINRQQIIETRFNQQEVEWLARIIMAEAEGEPYLGQLAVGAVILNRVQSRDFPNSIHGVIFDKWQHFYQFEPVQNGRIHQVRPQASHYQAAREVLAGNDPTNGALFFYNPAKSNSAWMRAKPVTLRIGNHVFMM